METTGNLQVTFNALVTNPGFIATRAMKPGPSQGNKKTGLNIGIKKLELESLEVIVGNGDSLAPGALKISKGDTVYIKADRYHQTWASEVFTSKGIEETVDGKLVPIEFILIPIAEVVLVSTGIKVAPVDWSNKYYWPWPPNQTPPPVYPPYVPGIPNIWCSTEAKPSLGESVCGGMGRDNKVSTD